MANQRKSEKDRQIVWKPSPELIRQANIKKFMDEQSIGNYRHLIEKSTQDIEWFWKEAIGDLSVEWFEDFDRVLDTSDGHPWAKWFTEGKINIAHNCLDRHAQSDKKSKVACIWEGEEGDIRQVTFDQLYKQSNRLANALEDLGLVKGDPVALYMPMLPEVISILYGCFKIGAIPVPIFSGFGPSAIATRLNDSQAGVLIMADGFSRRGKKIELKKNVDQALKRNRSVRKVIIYPHLDLDISIKDGRDLRWEEVLTSQSTTYLTRMLNSEDISLLLYSSGTTGKPKGCVHTHIGALLQPAKEIRYGFDLKDDDLFFWLSDIGWMMGPWMIIGVHNFGGTVFFYEGAPNWPRPDRLWDMVERHGITIFGISPTAIRALMREGREWVAKHDLSSLRILGSTGEPWDEKSWKWYFRMVGKGECPIINISGGTEIIGCFLMPLPIMPLKPCTLGGPGLGMNVDVYNEKGESVREKRGYLVCKKPAPSMTKGLWNDPQRYIDTYWTKWENVWYHGDWASIDKDGFWFLHGRSDDAINVAGRKVGPAEIEEAILDHPACSEVATIGIPHEIKGTDIACFVVLKAGYERTEELKEELKVQVINNMGKPFKPAEIHFVEELPKTLSGKIVRRAIQAKYLGEEAIEFSSLANPEALDLIGQLA